MMQEIVQIFVAETEGTLAQLESLIMQMEKNGVTDKPLNNTLRLVHNCKGSARTVGLEDLATIAHRTEDVLVKIKNKELRLDPRVSSVLLEALDGMKDFLTNVKRAPEFRMDPLKITEKLSALLAPAPKDEQLSSGTESSNNNSPELASKTTEVNSQNDKFKGTIREDDIIRVSTAKLDALLNLMGEITVNQSILKELRKNEDLFSSRALATVSASEKLINEAQTIALSLRMVPIQPLFQKLQRTARDVALTLKKDVAFELEGEFVELDRAILERLSDPLMHIIRNAMDHGIEMSDERLKSGKRPQAKVTISASQAAEKLVLSISDDGRGLNKEKILKKAIEKGLVSPSETLSEKAIFQLIFSPGFSTKDEVTSISGRGVGMDVVMEMVRDLKGTLEIDSVMGKGTTFKFWIPLSLSIISGMIVLVDNQKYIIPVSHLSETIRFKYLASSIGSMTGKVIDLRGELVPVLSLSGCLRHPLAEQAVTETPKSVANSKAGLVIPLDGKKISFEVDSIIGEQSVVLKKLGREFQCVPGIIAGAVLGSGEPGLVLNLEAFARERV